MIDISSYDNYTFPSDGIAIFVTKWDSYAYGYIYENSTLNKMIGRVYTCSFSSAYCQGSSSYPVFKNNYFKQGNDKYNQKFFIPYIY